MHIIDIIQNSVCAGATEIGLKVALDKESDRLIVVVEDNGKGMSAEEVERLLDPFFTSRTTRRVGLGLPLLSQTAEQSGGELGVESEIGKGTRVTAIFQLSHIDRPPMGDLAGGFVLNVVSQPSVEFTFDYRVNGKEYSFSTLDVKRVLGDDFILERGAFRLLKELIASNIYEMSNSLI